ncbi:MAG TPA: GMC oxidoreductase [Steroidobacteraceae bacterium]|nr:GMC oxidoreductase [Steroidobacteraceae bacterium]
MLIDARSVGAGAEFACDLCVVGAGPAGIAIAHRLRGSGLSIILLESGGFNLELPTQELYRGENRGDDYFRLDACRWRLFGGSSNRWGGWCRPLEAADFTSREWLPHSGWPIDAAALQPYHADAARLFELPNARFDLAAWRDRLPEPMPLEGSSFQNTVFQHSPETNFGDSFRLEIRNADNITAMLHANLVSIHLEPGSDRVGSLRVAALRRGTFNIRPGAVVLAAGGIENARLLLASQSDRPGGLGNEYDMVGRFFMEHLHVPAGHLVAATGSWSQQYFGKAIFSDVRLRGVITPTAAAQERFRLLSASIAVEGARYSFGTPFVGWPPRLTFGPVRRYRMLRDGRWKGLVERLKQAAEVAQSVPKKARTWNAARSARSRAGPLSGSERIYSLYFRSEQAPDPRNRVLLSTRRDALGIPQTRLDWRVKPIDLAAITGWVEVLDRDLRERSIGRVIAPPEGWQQGIIGGPHHMGSTRMSANPRHGVVDTHCQVHSVANLYVAGSSVFTTGGYANPTFALVTLALRLAETLRNRLGRLKAPAEHRMANVLDSRRLAEASAVPMRDRGEPR